MKRSRIPAVREQRRRSNRRRTINRCARRVLLREWYGPRRKLSLSKLFGAINPMRLFR